MCMEQTDGRQKCRVSVPLSNQEDSEATITSTHISLTKTSHMSLTSRGSTTLPQAHVITVVHLVLV